MELVPYPTLADSICDTCSPKKRTDLFYLTPIDIYNIDFFKLNYRVTHLGLN